MWGSYSSRLMCLGMGGGRTPPPYRPWVEGVYIVAIERPFFSS